MPEPIVVDFLRHGQVTGGLDVARGSIDPPLSEAGWQEMRTVGSLLEVAKLDRIATSPLLRCRNFAEELTDNSGASLDVLEGLREIHFGAWEGKRIDEIEDESLAKRFLENPVGVCPPNGEPFDDFSMRVIETWDQWIGDADGGYRLMIAHGGCIRVLLVHLLGMPVSNVWRLYLPYAAWCRFTLLANEQPRLMFMNKVPCKA